ncbi:MAG: hypothetical protein ACP5GJ_00430 [Nanopusillaceae archaeon]
MKLQSEAYVALLFVISAGIITILLYNILFPHISNINPTGQAITESLKINFQLLDYFIQNNTLYAYVKPSEPVNASQVFAIINNELVPVYSINSNSSIVNPYNNGLLLIVANLSQIPVDQNGNYQIVVGLENDIVGVFTIHYMSNALRNFFHPIIQYNVSAFSSSSSFKCSLSPPYYCIYLYNTQNISTPVPFQQDIEICNTTSLYLTNQNATYNLIGYNYTIGSVSSSGKGKKTYYSNAIITLPNSNIYLCLGAGNVSFSISYNSQENASGYAIIGYSNTNNCSASYSGSSVPDVVVGGYSINTTDYSFLNSAYYFEGTTFNNIKSFSYNYTVYNISNVTISIACGLSKCNSINIPAGCNVILYNTTADNSTTIFVANCYNQLPGNYNINGTLLTNGYVALGVYLFSPNISIYYLINLNGQNVYFFTNSSNPQNSLLYSWYEGQLNNDGVTCDVWWVNISQGIPANNYTTIYMNINSTNTNYYRLYYPYVGANPYVIQGYDNGQNVFLIYNNGSQTFQYTRIGTGGSISTTSTGPSPYNYDIVMSVNGGGASATTWTTTWTNSTQLPSSYIAQMLVYITGSSPLIDMLTNIQNYPNGAFYVFRFDARGTYYDGIGYYPAGGTGTQFLNYTSITSSTNTWYQMTVIDNNGYLYLYKSTSFNLGNYGNLEASYNTQGTSYYLSGRGFGITTDGATSTDYYTLILVRAYPPNGVMPQVYIS